MLVFIASVFMVSSPGYTQTVVSSGFPHGDGYTVYLSPTLTCRVKGLFAMESGPGVTYPLLLEFHSSDILESEDRSEPRDIEVRYETNGSVSSVFHVKGRGVTRCFLYISSLGDSAYGQTLHFYDHSTGLSEEVSHSFIDTDSPTGSLSSPFIVTLADGNAPKIANDFLMHRDSTDFSDRTAYFQTLNPILLPDRWIGLTGVDMLVVPHETWISPVMKTDPVLEWVAMGGVVLLIDVPEGEKNRLAGRLETDFALH